MKHIIIIQTASGTFKKFILIGENTKEQIFNFTQQYGVLVSKVEYTRQNNKEADLKIAEWNSNPETKVLVEETSRATYTTGKPWETTLENLIHGGWEWETLAEGRQKLYDGGIVTMYSHNGMRKLSVKLK